MASLEGGDRINSAKDTDLNKQKENRPSSVDKKITLMGDTNSTTIHWFAHIGPEQDQLGDIRDREEKLRLARERQNEERQRKIEELRTQAEAAQRYREQKEDERKKRIEELRSKDIDRRQQVEERKKAILEAEKERREYIIRKNQERETRLDARRKNDKGSIIYAFGSSTPRLLDPAELINVTPSTYWGHRRSTSITNVAYNGATLTRRSSERELCDTSKKRATSASGADRQNEEETTDLSTSYRSVARRKTDLMPTIPSPREANFGSKTSLHCHTPRTPGRAVSMSRLDQLAQPIRRNGEHIKAIIEREKQQQYELMFLSNTNPNTHTPNSPTTTKLFLKGNKNMSRSMTHLAGTKLISKQLNNDNGNTFRPSYNNDDFKSMTQLTASKRGTMISKKNHQKKAEKKFDGHRNLNSTGSRSGDVTPGGSINTSRPGSAMSTSTTASGLIQKRPNTTPKRPRPASIAGTGVSLNDDLNKHKKDRPPLPKVQSTPKRLSTSNSSSSPRASSADNKNSEKKFANKKETPSKQKSTQSLNEKNSFSKESTPSTKDSIKNDDKNNEKCKQIQFPNEIIGESRHTKEEKEIINAEKIENILSQNSSDRKDFKIKEPNKVLNTIMDEKTDKDNEKGILKENGFRETSIEKQENEMTASMIARAKITTEEEAKAALAERRRFAREEAERQAELEKQRLEAERQAEIRRQAAEEEKQRQLEEEALRLAEEQRKAEEERLLQAIEEAKKREEAEKLKREEDEKLRVEKEEQEKKAKEEAERQRYETAERLKREEKEREERRKRVEAIMTRTRVKGSLTPNSTPTKDNDNKLLKNDNKINDMQIITNEQTVTISEIEINQNDCQNISNAIENLTLNNDQNSYEKSVTEKENALIKVFTNNINDENSRNLQITNGKNVLLTQPTEILTHSIANGNGHIENMNKNEANIFGDQLINFDNESQQISENVSYNNNNNILTSSPVSPLVTVDSYEAKEISLL